MSRRLHLDELREEFDRSFAAPAREYRTANTEFLLVGVGNTQRLLAAGQIDLVMRRPNLRRVQMKHPAGAGLLASRGNVLVALRLADLLGLPSDRAETFALVNAKVGIALLVSQVEQVETSEAEGPNSLTVNGRPIDVIDLLGLLNDADISTTEANVG